MWQKIKDQAPAILITALLVIGAAYWLHRKTIKDMDQLQQEKLAVQKQEFDAQLKASAEDTRRQIEAVDKLLKDAIQRRSAEVFMSDKELAKLNTDHINQLAEAIATKIQPNMPIPKTPEEAERMQNEQVDKVSSRMAEKIAPILNEMASSQHLTQQQIQAYSQRISDQIGNVLTSEMAKNQQLNNNLLATQAVARESLALTHEVTALYLSTFKDQGLVTRLLTLPANVVRDVSKMSIISSSERKQKEKQLVDQMNAIDQRLNAIEAAQPKN
ncbi:hypothetical protein GALL_10370 [mine drainage metagenome]|uniref:Uncharacterized protein n=1 Tax=mine drainage metagenome TaxID=410659 RepID=A0A1J5TCR6_9ZZZZ